MFSIFNLQRQVYINKYNFCFNALKCQTTVQIEDFFKKMNSSPNIVIYSREMTLFLKGVDTVHY